MKRTLTNIKSTTILQTLRRSNAVTIAGRAAVENYKAFLVHNTMSAIALENSIVSLTTQIKDAGLEGLVATLKGIMPESKRKVAIAYELLAAKPANAFLSANEATFSALESLYDMDATKIVDAINAGVLDAYKTVPEVMQLIKWAKAAIKVEPDRTYQIDNADVSVSMVPVLNIATAGDDNMLVAIDGKTYLQSKRGALAYLPDASSISNMPEDGKLVIECLRMLNASESQPNMLILDSSVLESVRKAIPIESFGIDLLGGLNELVHINGNAMSVDKAKALLMHDKNELIASFIMSADAKHALKVLSTIMDIFEKYRGTISTNVYASKFKAGKVTFYAIEHKGVIATATIVNDSVVNTTMFNSAFDALSSEFLVTNPPLSSAFSQVFASQLKDEAKRMSVRKQVLIKLTDERKEYEALLERIKREMSDLELTADANPEKSKALSELHSKVSEKLATLAEEIDKLGK